MGDNAYEERVDSVVNAIVETFPNGDLPTKQYDEQIANFGKDTLEFRLKDRAWKDFVGDVKKKLVPSLREKKAESKKKKD